MRETEAVVLDTPERRAGLERRFGDLVRDIKDDTLRRHYGAELQGRLRDLIDPYRRMGNGASRRGPNRPSAWQPGRGRFMPDVQRGLVTAPLGGVSTSLAQSLARPLASPREVEIVALILAHPDLLDWHSEDLAHTDFASPEIARLRDGLLHCLSDHIHDAGALADALDAAGYAAVRHKILLAAQRSAYWWLKPGAAPADADQILRQALTLHHKARALHKDLRAAQESYARDDTEQNFAALLDIKARLAAFEGTEASVEGFGLLSGRQQGDV